MKSPNKFHMPLRYQITLKEHLDEKWSEWFEGMTISSACGKTILTGLVADQASLHGLFTRIRDLNLTLLSVACLQSDPNDLKHS